MAGKPDFPFDLATTNALEAALSAPRLAPYLLAANRDLSRALRLHRWNTAVRAAFLGPLEYLEIPLRNAMDREMGGEFGACWFDNTGFLPPLALQTIARVKSELQQDGKTSSPPNVVANLSFGFWVSLLQRRMDASLWRSCLHRAFRHGRPSRSEAHKRLNYLRHFRNRIAHHEPVFRRDLRADYQSILTTTAWISPAMRDFIAHHSRVEALLALSPSGCCPHF